MEYIPRHLEQTISTHRHGKSVIAVTGARQTGKSTMLRHMFKDVKEITLDDIRQKNLALTDPGLFISEKERPLYLDEIQYAPELLSFIKIEVDRDKGGGHYYLSGSQKFNMMKNMTESLAGRVAIFELLGLSTREIQRIDFNLPFIPTKEYIDKRTPTARGFDSWEMIYRGGYPEMNAEDIDWHSFYSDYTKTYIERDVYQQIQVADELKFINFMEVLAARTGCILNMDEISREVGVAQDTIKRWLLILKTSNIVYLLRPYSNNLTTRAIKAPKLYFLDTGLAAYLTHWETRDVLRVGAKSGDFFETFVIGEILKSYYNAGRMPNNLYYYRDKDKREIDLVIERNGILHPVEIKSYSNPDISDAQAFSVLGKKAPVGDGAIICQCDEVMALSRDVRAIPIWYI